MKTTVKSKSVAYVVSAILIVFCLFPIYWMLITSLKTSTKYTRSFLRSGRKN